MNRLTRDEMLHRALSMVDSKNLDIHDRPHGPIVDEAHSLSWLQDGVDLFHNEFPWQGAITTAVVTLQAGPCTLPADFILDVRDGLIVNNARCRRTAVQPFINATLSGTAPGTPVRYSWHGNALYVHPVPPAPITGTLWYYALPAVLGPAEKPTFPSDWVLVEYVRLRGMEWLRLLQPGTARAYATEQMGRLRQAGLHGEPESSELPLDSGRFLPTGFDRNAWMGAPVVGG